jgi:hypothetical protein
MKSGWCDSKVLRGRLKAAQTPEHALSTYDWLLGYNGSLDDPRGRILLASAGIACAISAVSFVLMQFGMTKRHGRRIRVMSMVFLAASVLTFVFTILF